MNMDSSVATKDAIPGTDVTHGTDVTPGADATPGTNAPRNLGREGDVDLSDARKNAEDETEAKAETITCSACTRHGHGSCQPGPPGDRTDARAVVKFCQDCNEYFCAECVKWHTNFTALQDHILVDYADCKYRKDSSTKPGTVMIDLPTERCRKHPTKLIDMYCRNHDLVACSLCFLPHYKLCSDIHYVPDIVAQENDESAATKVKEDVDATLTNLNAIVTSCEVVLSQLKAGKESGLATVREFRRQLGAIIDELETITSEQLTQRHRELSEGIKHEVDKVNAMTQLAQQRSVQLNRSDVGPSGRFVHQILGKQVVIEATTLIKSICKATSKVKLLYRNDISIPTYLSGLPALGTTRTTQGQKRQYGSLRNKLTYDIKAESDEEQCNIWGTCIAGTGSIVLADNANNKLKLIDKSTYKMVDTCVLPASPRSLCTINLSEVAVSLSNKSVSIVKITTAGLEVRQSLQLEHNCFGLAVKDSHMYISDGSQTVYKYTLDGDLIKTITQDQTGEAIFNESRDISIGDDGNMIHVADSRKGLVTLDKDGRVLWRYAGTELKGAYGVCIDGEGSLLVTGILSHNVLQFGTNGEQLGAIIKATEDVKNPVSVCYDKHNQRILVTKIGNYVYAFDFD